MGNKATPTYIRSFEKIRQHLNNIDPLSVMIDFEQSMNFSFYPSFGVVLQV
jgi:hypothetical protein